MGSKLGAIFARAGPDAVFSCSRGERQKVWFVAGAGRGVGAEPARPPCWRELMTTYKVGYFVGSLAKASLNRKLARALVHLAPTGLQLQEIPFGDLPLYSYDYDADFPPAAKALKDAIAAVDAVLFVTPEYNRSIPGALKNAIDWASRPYGKNSFTRKPSAIIGTSPGKIGTAVAQQHLRSILAFCNSPLMNSIEAYIQFTPGLIGDDGEVTDESTADFLRHYMTECLGFIERVYTALPRNP
jgi:chromate reductase, NAD(P)H dehydrogenase (quinone)